MTDYLPNQDKSPMFAGTRISCSSEDFAALSAEFLMAGKSLRFRAEGVSMQPLIQDGDVILVNPVEPGKIKQCDIILLKNQQGRALVHRVIHKQFFNGKLTYQTKGDHTRQADGYFSASDILGRVSAIERKGRQIKTKRFLFKVLSKWVCWYSRKQPRHTWLFRGIFHMLKRLPVFNHYLT